MNSPYGGGGGINWGMLGNIGENVGKAFAPNKQDPAVAQAQQMLGPESQASWQLGTQTNPANNYGGMWQMLSQGGMGGGLLEQLLSQLKR